MKRNILTMLLLSVCLWATAQNFDTSHSYVSERIYLNEEGTKYIDNVTYLPYAKTNNNGTFVSNSLNA